MKKVLSAALSAVLIVECAPFAEAASLWADRRERSEAFRGDKPGPSLLDVPGPAPLPHVATAGGPLPAFLQTLSPADVSLRRAVPSRSDRWVIHLQDVHMDLPAQEALGRAAASLAAGGADLVALEGAAAGEAVDVARFRAHPDRRLVRRVAEYLLRAGKISGPVKAAMTAPGAFPPVAGVEDPALYEANVSAYRRASVSRKDVERRLAEEDRALEDRKPAVFNPDLLAFDRKRRSFKEGALSLGIHVDEIRRGRAALGRAPAAPHMDRFAEALALEASLDFARVQADRSALAEALAARLPPAGMQELVDQAAAYRTGRSSHGAFHAFLSAAAARAGVGVAPALAAYFRYLSLAEAVDASALHEELESSAAAVEGRLTRSAPERALLAASARNALSRKLASFTLTPAEWRSLSALGTGDAGLAPFAGFYRAAEARDAAMAKNLLAAMDASGARKAVLVAGGFHAGGLAAALKAAGAGYASATPRFAPADAAGADYLSAFEREKTPLERLFAAPRLALATHPSEAGFGEAPAVAAGAALVDAARAGTLPEAERDGAAQAVYDAFAAPGQGAEVRGCAAPGAPGRPADAAVVTVSRPAGAVDVTVSLGSGGAIAEVRQEDAASGERRSDADRLAATVFDALLGRSGGAALHNIASEIKLTGLLNGTVKMSVRSGGEKDESLFALDIGAFIEVFVRPLIDRLLKIHDGILEVHRQIAALPSLEPGPRVDLLFGQLWRTLDALAPGPLADLLLKDDDVRGAGDALRGLHARRVLLEDLRWARRALEAPPSDAARALADYPAFDRRERLAAGQVRALEAALGHPPQRTLSTGSPLAALLLARLIEGRVDALVRDAELRRLATAFAGRLSLGERVRFLSAAEPGAVYDAVVSSPDEGGPPEDAAALLSPEGALLVQSARGLKSLLSPTVERVEGLDPAGETGVAGSRTAFLRLFRPRGASWTGASLPPVPPEAPSPAVDPDRASESAARAVLSHFAGLSGQPSLEPSDAVNGLFTGLVSLSLTPGRRLSDAVLRDPRVAPVLPALRSLCSTGEYLMERHWARRMLAEGLGFDAFPYYRNYVDLTRLEVSALEGVAGKGRVKRVLFIGSGPMPLTSFVMAERHGLRVDNVERDGEAWALSSALARGLSSRRRLRFHRAGILDFNDLSGYDAVFLAALVGMSPEEKTRILSHLHAGMREGALLLVRSAHGFRRLLYAEVDPESLGGFAPEVVVHPHNHVVNSFIVARKGNASENDASEFRRASRPLKLYWLNDFVFNLGFSALAPYLALHLAAAGLSPWWVGAVLGLRNLSQHGLYLAGAALSDRWGGRISLAGGSVLRAAGFILFGAAAALPDPLPFFAAAAVLSGLGAALSIPAAAVGLVRSSGGRVEEAISVSEVMVNAGTLLGPLVGVALWPFGFRWVAAGAGGVFLAWAAVLWRFMPGEPSASRAPSGSWRAPLSDGRFLRLLGALAISSALFSQLMMSLPLAWEEATGWSAGAGILTALAAAAAVAAQGRVTAWLKARVAPEAAVALGLAVMGGAFLPLTAASLLPGLAAPWAPFAAAALALSLGQMASGPFARALVPAIFGADNPRLGVYKALSLMAMGLGGGVAGKWLVGGIADVGIEWGAPWLTWAVLSAVGLAGAAWYGVRSRNDRSPPSGGASAGNGVIPSSPADRALTEALRLAAAPEDPHPAAESRRRAEVLDAVRRALGDAPASWELGRARSRASARSSRALMRWASFISAVVILLLPGTAGAQGFPAPVEAAAPLRALERASSPAAVLSAGRSALDLVGDLMSGGALSARDAAAAAVARRRAAARGRRDAEADALDWSVWSDVLALGPQAAFILTRRSDKGWGTIVEFTSLWSAENVSRLALAPPRRALLAARTGAEDGAAAASALTAYVDLALAERRAARLAGARASFPPAAAALPALTVAAGNAESARARAAARLAGELGRPGLKRTTLDPSAPLEESAAVLAAAAAGAARAPGEAERADAALQELILGVMARRGLPDLRTETDVVLDPKTGGVLGAYGSAAVGMDLHRAARASAVDAQAALRDKARALLEKAAAHAAALRADAEDRLASARALLAVDDLSPWADLVRRNAQDGAPLEDVAAAADGWLHAAEGRDEAEAMALRAEVALSLLARLPGSLGAASFPARFGRDAAAEAALRASAAMSAGVMALEGFSARFGTVGPLFGTEGVWGPAGRMDLRFRSVGAARLAAQAAVARDRLGVALARKRALAGAARALLAASYARADALSAADRRRGLDAAPVAPAASAAERLEHRALRETARREELARAADRRAAARDLARALGLDAPSIDVEEPPEEMWERVAAFHAENRLAGFRLKDAAAHAAAARDAARAAAKAAGAQPLRLNLSLTGLIFKPWSGGPADASLRVLLHVPLTNDGAGAAARAAADEARRLSAAAQDAVREARSFREAARQRREESQSELSESLAAARLIRARIEEGTAGGAALTRLEERLEAERRRAARAGSAGAEALLSFWESAGDEGELDPLLAPERADAPGSSPRGPWRTAMPLVQAAVGLRTSRTGTTDYHWLYFMTDPAAWTRALQESALERAKAEGKEEASPPVRPVSAPSPVPAPSGRNGGMNPRPRRPGGFGRSRRSPPSVEVLHRRSLERSGRPHAEILPLLGASAGEGAPVAALPVTPETLATAPAILEAHRAAGAVVLIADGDAAARAAGEVLEGFADVPAAVVRAPWRGPAGAEPDVLEAALAEGLARPAVAARAAAHGGARLWLGFPPGFVLSRAPAAGSRLVLLSWVLLDAVRALPLSPRDWDALDRLGRLIASHA